VSIAAPRRGTTRGAATRALALHADGWLASARRVPSPHYDARPPGTAIDLLLIHNISLPPGVFGGDAIERLFAGTLADGGDPFLATLRGLRVSAHFLLRRDGEIVQFVSVHDRAWHAGASVFDGRVGCNDFSVSIELEGSDFVPFADAQYTALARLTRALRAALPLAAVRGHSDVAPGRKTDPGPHFDWRRYARAARLPVRWLPPAART
jgi:AmpD protein